MTTRCVSRDEARKGLSSVISFVETDREDVLIGSSEETALCAFVTLDNYAKEGGDVYPNEVDDIDIDDLRKNWAMNRKVVEYGGRCLRILKNSKPICFLVPTSEAHDKNIELLEGIYKKRLKTQIKEDFLSSELAKNLQEINVKISDLSSSLGKVGQRVADLSKLCPSEDESREFAKMLAVGRRMLDKWREIEGHSPVPTLRGDV